MATTIISGAAAIDDSLVEKFIFSKNWGAHWYGRCEGFGGPVPKNAVIKLDESLISSGAISEARFHWYESGFSGTNDGRIYRIAHGNIWTNEGTKDGATATAGEVTGGWRIYNTDEWLGGKTYCHSYGIDYDADASPPLLSGLNSAGWRQTILPSVWFSDWRDAVRNSNGFVAIGPANGAFVIWDSTENPGNPPYFEIDTADGPAGHRTFIDMAMHQ